MGLSILLFAGISIITGLLFGKLAKFVHLPNVTGYLVGGLVIGPSFIGLLNDHNIKSLELVSSVALGFIAFSIGNELKLAYFREVGLKPVVIAVFEALFGVVFVLGGLILYFVIFMELTIQNIQFALILSAIAAATAPAATLMVVRQYKAKGPLTKTLMSVVAIDDSIAILLFGILVAISTSLNPNNDLSIISQIFKPFIEIISSLVVGFVFGVILTLGCKWYTGRGNRISLTIGIIFITIFLTDYINGSTLLACMILGGTFANLSKKFDEINGLIYFITPPIFIMFFVLSGAELKLSVLFTVGIASAIIYILFRVFGKIFGAWFGAKITKAEPMVAKYLGYALIPQAGVAIGLSFIATQILDEKLGVEIRTIILCATLIYELIGPIITKITLKKAKEIEA